VANKKSWLLGLLAMSLMGSSVRVSSSLVHAPLLIAQAARYGAAALLVLLLSAFRIAPGARPPLAPRGREWAWLTGVAATGLALFNVAVVRGLLYAQPAAITVVLAGVPVGLGLTAPIVGQRGPTARLLLGAAIVTAGGVMVERGGKTSWPGVGFAAMALVCEICFTLLGVPVLGRHRAWGVSFHSAWIAALVLAIMSVPVEGPGAAGRLSPADWAAIAVLAAMTVVAFVCWYSAVSYLGPGRAGLLTGAAPVAAALATVASGGAAPAGVTWGGILVVTIGLAVGLGATSQDARNKNAFLPLEADLG
jgi:drug/metabolite transporter (DMT)-like permease